MIGRALVIVAVAHALYAALWIVMDPAQQRVFERYAVLATEVIAVAFYGVLVVAFYEAKKTRLNVALAVQKLFWLLLIGLIALPATAGLAYHRVPYRAVNNPYALWDVPAWLRVYIWIGITVSLIGVLWEFYRANWGSDPEPAWPEIERRRDPYGRRRSDWPEGQQL